MKTSIAELKHCPIAKGKCVSTHCMLWRSDVYYDEYGPNRADPESGYCGLAKQQEMECDLSYLK